MIILYISKSTPFYYIFTILLLLFFLSNYPIKIYTNKTSLLIKTIFGGEGGLLVSGRIPFYFYKITSNSKEIKEKYTFIYVN